MVMTVLVPLALILACLAALCGRRPHSDFGADIGADSGAVSWLDVAAWSRSCAIALTAIRPGERVLAVLRPDLEVGLSLTALAAVATGMILSLGSALFGTDALVPLALSLACLLTLPALGWVVGLRHAWVVTDRRLIAGRALEMPLSDLTDLRVLPLAVEVRGTGGRCLRLSVLLDAPTAAAAIQAAIQAAARAQGAPPAAR